MTDWYETAAKLDRRAFAAQHAHPFLLVLRELHEDLQEFRTISLVRESKDSTTDGDVPGSVLPVVKTAANPYGGMVIVGRARNCDVVLRHASVSKVHADFRVLGPGEAELTDRSSRNGVWVNAAKVAAGQTIPLHSGDRIAFGAVAAAFLDPTALHEAIT